MKGFTLIELIAVIVILAIILLISVPLVSDVIKNSKNAALESSAKSIKKAAKDSFMNDQLLGKEIDEVIYVFEDGIQRTIPTTASKIEISGEVPKNGYIKVNKETVDLEFNDGEKTIVIDKANKPLLTEGATPIQLPIIHKCGTPYTDIRDGKIYNTVKIGNECWFSDDLAYTAHGCLSRGWNDQERACRVINMDGVDYITYQRNAYFGGEPANKVRSKGICPDGFMLPSQLDYMRMKMSVMLNPERVIHALKLGHHGGTNLIGLNFTLTGSYSPYEVLTAYNDRKVLALSDDVKVIETSVLYGSWTLYLTNPPLPGLPDALSFGVSPWHRSSKSVRCIQK